MRYSPILKRYLDLKKYKTRNFLKPNTMKLTPFDDSQAAYEKRLWVHQQAIAQAEQKKKEFEDKVKRNVLFQEMNEQIKKIKLKAIAHSRMLEEKRREEAEKGACEYANYVVSMINAGTNNYITDQ